MANFATDFFKGITKQQETPEFRLANPSEILSGVAKDAGQAAGINVDYANAVAPGYARAQRKAEDIYDPNQAKLREATTSSILQQLSLGSALPADVQQQVIQNALQGSSASGFGLSNGGRGLVAKDLGLTSLDLLNDRQDRAAKYTRSAPGPNELFSPTDFITPADIADMIIGNQTSQNQFNAFASNLKSQNRANMAETPYREASKGASLFGSVMGGMTGMGGMGGGGGGGGASAEPMWSAGFNPARNGRPASVRASAYYG